MQRLAVVGGTAQRQLCRAEREMVCRAAFDQSQRLNELERRSGECRLSGVTHAEHHLTVARINHGTMAGMNGFKAFVTEGERQGFSRREPVGGLLGRDLGGGARIADHLIDFHCEV